MSHPRQRQSNKSHSRSGRERSGQSGRGRSGPRQAPALRPEVDAQQLTLEIDSLNSEGQGVARRGRDVYFVPGALPGETVEVQLDGRRKKIWYTRLRQVISPAAERTEPHCRHYQRCGGCDMQHLSYDAQVNAKQARVEREFQRQHIEVECWQPAITATPWHYRRKARLGVRFSKADERNFIGFREAASSHISDIDQCPVLVDHPALDWQAWRDCISSLAGRDRISQIEMIDADNALALILRELKPLSSDDRQALCDFIQTFPTTDKPLQLWLKTDTNYHCLFPQNSPDTLFHRVQALELNMALDDFIQVNAGVNRQMVDQALDWLNPESDERIWDLFAGHGNFSMPLATRSQQVTAVEVQDSMVSSLKRQAEKLALPLLGRKADLSQPGCLADLPQPDAVLLDPPRAGAAEVAAELIRRRVPKIVYVSCDVATLARDLAQLTSAGYQVVKAGIMDMFPQTHHVETMVLLRYSPG
ncbi:rRNA adenine N-6-methyltransferase family protein [Bacterioplanoides sp.]|uniref:rRNA adenine N-6-methyltransferase family protein n=1 Tax=Bacterioplanoides sp. TaxID=2066072 RepID=UPI003B0073A3